MIEWTSGDMFRVDVDVRVNTVNCVGVMGAGVALAFKERYPDMFRAYKRACKNGEIQPGKLDIWHTLTEWVVNFPTKQHWRNKSEYRDIEAGLRALREYLLEKGNVSVALPALGCGHGGLDWELVSKMIETELMGLDARILVFAPSDSRALGETTKRNRADVSLAGIPVKTLAASDATFPSRIQIAGVNGITLIGEEVVDFGRPMAAIETEGEKSQRAMSASAACVEAISFRELNVLLDLDHVADRNLIPVVVEHGAFAVLVTCTEVSKLKIDGTLRDYLRIGKAAVLVVNLRPGDETKDARCVRAALADTVVLTGRSPNWPPKCLSYCELPPTYFVWYKGTSKQRLGHLLQHASPLGRNRQTTKPNMAQVLSHLLTLEDKDQPVVPR